MQVNEVAKPPSIEGNFLTETKGLLFLVLPMTIGAILEALVPFINVFMLARLSPQMVAAAALVNTLFAALLMVFWGIFSAVSTLIAERYGEKNNAAISQLVVTSCWLALISGGVIGVLLWKADVLLVYIGQPTATIELARGYFHGLAFAAIADFFTYALFGFFQGIMQSSITMVLSFVYVPINIAINYLLMNGKWGFPAMGAAGVGFGTAIAFWLLVLFCLVIILVKPDLRAYFKGSLWPRFEALKALLTVGVPLGLLWAVIFVFFFVITALMGKISDTALAAYQLVRQWVDIFFVLGYCLSRALGIKIAEAIGMGQRQRMALITKAALGLNTVFMVLVVIVLVGFSEKLLKLDLGNLTRAADLPLIAFALTFFKIAAVSMVFDSVRTLYFGALLGLKDSFYLLMTGAVCWLGVGIPVAFAVSYLSVQSANSLWWVCVLCEVLGLVLLMHRYKRWMSCALV